MKSGEETLSQPCYPRIRITAVFSHLHRRAFITDSGGFRVKPIFGDREIEIVRRLGLPTNPTENFRIRTANEQVARIRDEIELLLQLRDVSREITVCLLAKLAVPFIEA